jgi:hypothetical protein
MSIVRLYFQYTHFSNIDLSTLRTTIANLYGKMQLISSKSLHLQVPVVFGKLLVVTLPVLNFKFSFVTELLTKFTALHLLFINYDSFMLSPGLYLSYLNHRLYSIHNIKLYCLSFALNNIRLLLYRLKYLKYVLNILFQENFLYKYTSQFIC